MLPITPAQLLILAVRWCLLEMCTGYTTHIGVEEQCGCVKADLFDGENTVTNINKVHKTWCHNIHAD